VGSVGSVGAEVTSAVGALLGMVDWSAVRSMPGGSGFVPQSVARLLLAESEEDAAAAYWELDNRVVVQGQLFEAARWIVAPLVSALQVRLAPPSRRRVVDLLVEIALGVPDQSECEAGNEELGEACRQEIKQGLWCFYGLLDDDDARVRIGAIDVLDAVDSDRRRLARVMAEVGSHDHDPDVRARAVEAGREAIG
jgi:hypothetical protein